MLKTVPLMLGQYRPMDSFLHRLDARASLVPIGTILVLSLMTVSVGFYAATLIGLIGLLLFSGVGLASLAKCFKPILVLVLITFAYHMLFSGRGTPVTFRIIGLPVYSGAVAIGLFYSLRLVLFVSVAFFMTLTNSPSELSEAFIAIMRPLRRLRVPVNDLGLIVFIAMRFIPVLYEEFVMIRNAQIVRGVSFSGSWIGRARKTTALLIPVFAAAIARADELALAIEARGYDSFSTRTTYTHARFGVREITFALGGSLIVTSLFFLTRPL